MVPKSKRSKENDAEGARRQSGASSLKSEHIREGQAFIIGNLLLDGQRQSSRNRLYMAFYYLLVVSALLVIGFATWTAAQGALSGHQVKLASDVVSLVGTVVLLCIAVYFRSKTFSD